MKIESIESHNSILYGIIVRESIESHVATTIEIMTTIEIIFQ